MGNKSLKDHSKTLWVPSAPDSKYPGDVKIQIGCLQRIADSLEKMEQPFKRLLDDAQRYEKYYRDEREENKRLSRRISALQGVITKMKKKSLNP